MDFYEHDCPSCRCPNTTAAQAWADASLIHTRNPTDQILVKTLYWQHREWTLANMPDQSMIVNQNKFTRWLSGRYRVNNLGGRNVLVGYKLNNPILPLEP